jgi:carbohydrate diacid regulator
MISSQVIQNILYDTVAITNTSAAVFERGGRLVASKGNIEDLSEIQMESFLKSPETEDESDDFYFSRVGSGNDTVYGIAVRKGSEHTVITARLLAMQITSQVNTQKDKIDKDDFVKNLLLDNLLQIDIFNRARKLGIEYKAPRVVYVIESEGQDSVYDLLKNLPFFGANDFLTGIDEGKQIIVHEVRNPGEVKEELRSGAEEMLRTLKEQDLEAHIAYGSVVNELKGVSLSYKEARLAHDVRRIFYEDSQIISYNELGIGRLIYQLPINLCRMFINEIFGGRNFDEFDEETLMTINKFFENNLNVSETSRQLFIHRNTLVYRLDKLMKSTGLDLRVFDDAITFKIALMVVKYMAYMEKMDTFDY